MMRRLAITTIVMMAALGLSILLATMILLKKDTSVMDMSQISTLSSSSILQAPTQLPRQTKWNKSRLRARKRQSLSRARQLLNTNIFSSHTNPSSSSCTSHGKGEYGRLSFNPIQMVYTYQMEFLTADGQDTISPHDVSSTLQNLVIDELIPQFFLECRGKTAGDGTTTTTKSTRGARKSANEDEHGQNHHYYNIDPQYESVVGITKTSTAIERGTCNPQHSEQTGHDSVAQEAKCLVMESHLIIYMHDDWVNAAGSTSGHHMITTIESIISNVMDEMMIAKEDSDVQLMVLTLMNVMEQGAGTSDGPDGNTGTGTGSPITKEETSEDVTHFTFHENVGDGIYSYAWLSAIVIYVFTVMGTIVILSRRKLRNRREQFELLQLEEKRQMKIHEDHDDERTRDVQTQQLSPPQIGTATHSSSRQTPPPQSPSPQSSPVQVQRNSKQPQPQPIPQGIKQGGKGKVSTTFTVTGDTNTTIVRKGTDNSCHYTYPVGILKKHHRRRHG